MIGISSTYDISLDLITVSESSTIRSMAVLLECKLIAPVSCVVHLTCYVEAESCEIDFLCHDICVMKLDNGTRYRWHDRQKRESSDMRGRLLTDTLIFHLLIAMKVLVFRLQLAANFQFYSLDDGQASSVAREKIRMQFAKTSQTGMTNELSLCKFP